VTSAMRVAVGRYTLGTGGTTYPVVGDGVLYPSASYSSKTHAWIDDLALVELSNWPVGEGQPLPLAPTASVLAPSPQSIAFGYGSATKLMSTSASAFSTVPGGQGTCPAWALCFDQAANERLSSGDSGGPWTIPINGTTVGIAVTSTSSSALKQRVTATPIAGAGSPLAWIRATTHLSTPFPGEIWTDDHTHQSYLIDQDGYRRPISDATYVCLVASGTQATELDPPDVQSDPELPAAPVSCQPGPGARGGPGAVAGGANTACALMIGGGADCWGDDTGAANYGGPSIHQVYGISDATQIAVGTYSACLVRSTGAVGCWGGNGYGEIGTGSLYGDHQTPAPVINVEGATDVAVGTGHACAVLSSGGVDCWGDDEFGQLGFPNTGPGITQPTPSAVPGIADATSLAAGDSFTCATLSTGGVDCWGRDQNGQLGNGANDYRDMAPQPVVGITDAVGVAAGEDHGCAVLSSGGIECWGENEDGQLGDGSTAWSNVPVPVTGITNAIEVSAGYVNSCALLSTGAVECWGDNSNGQLGDGSLGGGSLTPVPAIGISDATGIASGQVFSCATLEATTVDCWGSNYSGTLGDLWVPDSGTPTSVLGIP
jgi:hypothetical protein